jgi:hypothetical protein
MAGGVITSIAYCTSIDSTEHGARHLPLRVIPYVPLVWNIAGTYLYAGYVL